MQTLTSHLPRALAVGLALAITAGCSREAKTTRLVERADGHLKAGELDKARIEYLNLLRTEPLNVTAIQQLGLVWMEQGAPLRALPFLLKAREQSPGDIEVRLKLASALLSVGQVAEARQEALAILQLAPSSGEALILVADTARTAAEIAETSQSLAGFPQPDSASFHLASAKLHLLKGDLHAAVSGLQQALSQDPKSATAHMALATYYLFQKKPEEAGREMQTAAELSPIRSTARLKYAEFKAQTGASTEAKAMLHEMTQQAPDYLPGWCLLAQLASADRQPDEALALLENVFNRDADYFDARMLQSQIWLNKGEVKKTIEGLERLEVTYPNVPSVKFQLARAHLQDRNPGRAGIALEKAVSLYPDYVEAILLLGEVNLRAGEVAPVVTAMQALLKKSPELRSAQLLLAESYRTLGRLDEAAGIFREQLKAEPKNSQPYFLLGLVLRQQNKLPEAREAFQKAQELAPENLQPTAQLVDLDIAEKDFAKALQRVQQLGGKAAGGAIASFLEGKIHAAQRQWDQAETALLKALEQDPEMGNAYDLLVAVYIAAEQLPRALSQLDGVLAKKPGNPRALMLQALIYDRTNEPAKGRDAYEKLLAAKPEFLLALNNLAYLYAEKLNQLDRAYDLARKARELQPNDGAVADTLGWILYKRGDYPQALSLLEESAKKLPTSPEVQFHLGMANYMMGQTDAARAALRLAEATAGDFPGKVEARQRLALLGTADGAPAELSDVELEAILKQQPNDILARMRLAESHEQQAQYAKAAEAYEKAHQLNPKLLAAAMKLAQLHADNLHNPEKALEFAKKAREIAPTDPKTAAVLGRAAYQTGDYAWACSLLQESSRALPDNMEILSNLAWATYNLGKVKEAQATMQRIAEAADSPFAASAKTFLAMTALGESTPDLLAAEPEVKKLLQANPGYVPALMIQGAIQMQRALPQAAISTYLEVLRLLPNFAPAQKRLASLYVEIPEHQGKAQELAAKARRTLPDDPELIQILAALSYQRKEFSSVVQLLRESARKDVLDARSLYYLGMSYRQTRNKPQCQETLQRALTAGLPDPFAAEAKRALAELDQK